MTRMRRILVGSLGAATHVGAQTAAALGVAAMLAACGQKGPLTLPPPPPAPQSKAGNERPARDVPATPASQ